MHLTMNKAAATAWPGNIASFGRHLGVSPTLLNNIIIVYMYISIKSWTMQNTYNVTLYVTKKKKTSMHSPILFFNGILLQNVSYHGSQ